MSQRIWTSAQLDAINSYGQDILVSAAAGSGKTATLTERVIRAVIGGDEGRPPIDISRMLIVTYTRAAAAELRERISDALEKAIESNPSDRRLFRQLTLLPSAQIRTIDAFYNEPVRANFERLGLNASFRIADESELSDMALRIMSDVIERFYERYGEDLATNEFVFFIENFINAREQDAVAKEFTELYKLLENYPESIEIIKKTAEMQKNGADKDFFETEYGKVVRANIAEFLEFAKQALTYAVDISMSDDVLCKKYLGAMEYDLNFCRSASEKLSCSTYEQMRLFSKEYEKQALKALPKGRKDAETERIKNLRASVSKNFEKLRDNTFAQTQEQISLDMKTSARIIEMMYSLLFEFDRCFKDEKNRMNVLGFTDVRNCMLKLLLDENGNPTDIALAYREQFDCIYIDEYQDVDEVQDLIFSTIGNGQNRFMVGDIKQSIYGFRGAESSIFARYRKLFGENIGGRSIFMANNFRCSENIINFANTVCSFIFGACKDSIDYQKNDDLIFSKPVDNRQEGYVCPKVSVVLINNPKAKKQTSEIDTDDESSNVDDLPFEESDTADSTEKETAVTEAAWVACEIAKILNGKEKKEDGSPIRASDIAVLSRSTKCGAAIAKELEKLGISTDCPVQKDVMHSVEMTDLLNFLRSVSNPQYDVSFSCALNSAICGFSLDEIIKIRSFADSSASMYDATVSCSSQDTALGKKCLEFLNMLNEYRRLSSGLTVERLLRLIYRDSRLGIDSSCEAALILYESARKYDSYSYSGLVGFIKNMDMATKQKPKSKSENDGDSVSILTIHTSKGLEFPVCFVCGCTSAFDTRDTRKTFVFDRHLGIGFRIDTNGGTLKRNTPMRSVIENLITTRIQEEEMRILYVALTRARERLYVVGECQNTSTLLSKADVCSFGSRPNILSGGNYMCWVLSGILNAGYKIDGKNEASPFEIKEIFQTDAADIELCKTDTAQAVDENTDIDGNTAANSDARPEGAGDIFIRSVLKGKEKFVYPYEILSKLPSKMSVTGIGSILSRLEGGDDSNSDESDVLDELSHMMDNMSDLYGNQPSSESNNASAAQIGTAFHAFLQFCDFGFLSSNGTDAEIERQKSENFIDESTATLIPKAWAEKFRQSSLLNVIQNASNIRREFRFSIFPLAREFVNDSALSEQLGDTRIQIQGAIDLLIETKDGDIILCDYKTDRLTERELQDKSLVKKKMNRSHGLQLSYYAKAIEQMYGKPPSSVWVYSIPLGDTVEIDIFPVK